MEDPTRTRDRIIAEAMRLFGEQGYAATRVAQIEAAAGLSPGAGGLYRHFPSKHALLAEGVRRYIAQGADLIALIADHAAFAALPPRERFAVLARAGLRRLDQERDLNRLIVRDLARFPDLLAETRDGELVRAYRAVAAWLAEQAGPTAPERDWPALAVVLVDSVVNYWRMCDVFGGHPAGVDEDRYLAAFVELAAGLIGPDAQAERTGDEHHTQ